MKMKNLNHIKKFFLRNYVFIFIAVVFLILSYSIFKSLTTQSKTVYVKIKVGQGMWWAQTGRPSIWFVNALKKDQGEYDLVGRPTAKILDVQYYPSETGTAGNYDDSGINQFTNQYDVYLTLKVNVSFDKKYNKYYYKRSSVLIGSPIDFEFSSAAVTGTVIDISDRPFNDHYVDKTVQLVFRGGYKKDFPYLFEKINVGDSYFDGKNKAIEIIDKWTEPMVINVSNINAQIYEREVYSQQNIVVKAKIRLKEKNNTLIFGEEKVVGIGSGFNIITPNYIIGNFIVSRID